MNNNLQEYDNPSLYDYENDAYKEDATFLRELAKDIKGPLIDLACGTGRVTIPLAEAGHEIIGVDIHAGMLDLAAKKSCDLSIKWIQQDCTKLNLGVKSSFIFMVGNSFQHFLTNKDQDLLLQSVHNHLEQDGLFIFNTRFPSKEELMQPSTPDYWRSYPDPMTGQHIDVYTISEYGQLNQIQHYTTIRRAADGSEEKSNIQLRYVYPQEMERLAAANDFQILAMYRDWKENPLAQDSLEMVCIFKKLG